MKKLIITVVLALTTSFMGMTTWAAAIGSGTLKKDFSSGSTLSSSEMNDNFSVIENAVNSTNALTTTLPDGVSTYLSFYLAPPNDYTTGNTTVNAYWSGCEGTNVRRVTALSLFMWATTVCLLMHPSCQPWLLLLLVPLLTRFFNQRIRSPAGSNPLFL